MFTNTDMYNQAKKKRPRIKRKLAILVIPKNSEVKIIERMKELKK